MKNLKNFLGGVIMLSLMAFSVVSCDKLTDDGKDKGDSSEEVCDKCNQDPCICDTPNPDLPSLQPSEQKTKLAEVGQKLMDKMPASEWETYSRISEDFANSVYMSDEYDWSPVIDWYEEQADQAIDEDYLEDGSFSTEILILMANHTGLFDCTENGVTVSDYDGNKAIFYMNGKTYEAEITTDGKVTNAIYTYDVYSTELSSDINGGDTNITREYEGEYTFTVGVPEYINLAISENGSPLMNVDLKLTPDFSKDGIDITTDSFSLDATVSINGFEVNIKNVAYDAASGEAGFSQSFWKNDEKLFSASSSAKVSIELVEDEYGTYVEANKAQNINVAMDILGEIQAKGSCTDAIEAAESLEAMWDGLYSDTADEVEAKRHLDNFNAKISINVYYDGNDTRQAEVKFDLSKYDSDGYTYYDLVPIIEFSDGSKYKIEEFFTEEAFGGLADSFSEFCESFETVFGFAF